MSSLLRKFRRKRDREEHHLSSTSQEKPGGCEHTQSIPDREDEHSVRIDRDSGEQCHICREAKRKRRNYRLKIVGALFVPSVLSNIDAMIVAPAMPTIASYFGLKILLS
jgi:hypothetical protein